MRPSSIATSMTRPAAPVPSYTVPLRITSFTRGSRRRSSGARDPRRGPRARGAQPSLGRSRDLRLAGGDQRCRHNHIDCGPPRFPGLVHGHTRVDSSDRGSGHMADRRRPRSQRAAKHESPHENLSSERYAPGGIEEVVRNRKQKRWGGCSLYDNRGSSFSGKRSSQCFLSIKRWLGLLHTALSHRKHDCQETEYYCDS